LRTRLLLPLLLIAGGCQTSSRPYAPVENVRYAALGQDPFWMVTIGDDRIVLALPPPPGARSERPVSHVFPRTLPRTVDGIQRWESGEGTAVISVEAMAGPCEGAGGQTYRDRVRVRLSGREMHGCGGPRLDG
jgi:uncharacterized membrane protein